MIKGKKKEILKRELNVSSEKSSNLKLQLFSRYSENQNNFFSVYDLIWINFSEENVI